MVEDEPIKTTVEELRKLVNIQNFIGEPIEVEDKVIIPVSKVGVAFGVGENKSEKVLGGAAGGAGIEPVSMVVITKGASGIEGIRNINLTEGNEVNKAMLMIFKMENIQKKLKKLLKKFKKLLKRSNP